MLKTIHHPSKTRLITYIIVLLTVVGAGWYSYILLKPAQAAPVVGFLAGKIIDDSVFTNKSSMSVSQIQNFLNSKVPTCDTAGAQISEYGGPDLNGDGKVQRWEWGQSKYNQSTFVCLRNYIDGGKSSAQIIFDAAQEFSINPQVLIVLLQKEQGLITDTWPLNVQYRSATGYGCPDTAACDSQYYGLTNQIRWAARMFRSIMNASPGWYTPYVLGNNTIQFNPQSSCGSTVVNIQNRSTQALYNYTPYQPNAGALEAGWGTAPCGAYGNRNFYLYFQDWFGSTYGTFYAGYDYGAVFDSTYYLNNYPDLQTALSGNPTLALSHFVNHGMSEGRRGSENFSVTSYKNRYQDIRFALRNNTKDYYLHYITFGKREGRIATGDITLTPVTTYSGTNYSSVYNFTSYLDKNADLNTAFKNDDVGAIIHFVANGMKEGRVASDVFNITSYKNANYDLRRVFGNDLKSYYLHYINLGEKEGRVATGDEISGTAKLDSVDYTSVYNFSTYLTNYSDIRAIYGTDNDVGALSHFVTYGMTEGRQANNGFSVQKYRNNYGDLQAAFGNDLKSYYFHYINLGEKEGRVAI